MTKRFGQDQMGGSELRGCSSDDAADMLSVINAAAQIYHGAIPADRWRDPYMSAPHLSSEMLAGVRFTGCWSQGRLRGVMGVQAVLGVHLIRHAYVLPERQGEGIGARLLDHLCADSDRTVLIGTWAAASWATAFYEKHGFRLVPEDAAAPLLRRYWSIPARQAEESVVLARPQLSLAQAAALITAV